MIDRWDALGLTGLSLLVGGVVARWGWSWGAMLLGLVLLGIYGVRESQLARGGRD